MQYPSASGVQATSAGSRLSDTSSASTDDSGVSVSFEHGIVGGNGGPVAIPGGPLESCASSEYSSGTMMFQSIATSTQSELINSAYTPGPPMSVSRVVEPLAPHQQSLQLPVFLADNLQHKISELKQVATVAGPTRFSIDAPLPSSSSVGGDDFRDGSEWNSSAHTVGIIAPGHPGISTHSKHHHQQHQHHQLGSREALATWPIATPPGTAHGIGSTGASGGKPRSTSSHLLYNMFSKTEDGTRWQCEECKRLFSSQGSLRAHARIHTGERPYQCQYCFRTFCQASTLRSHERLHTGEKPYKCEHCGRAFTQSAGLRSHLKTHRYDS